MNQTLYELARGPLVWAALAVFFGGLVLQGMRFFALTKKGAMPMQAPVHKKAPAIKGKKPPKGPGMLARLSAWSERQSDWLKQSVFLKHPVIMGVSVLFHVILFVAPLMALAHNQLIAGSIGFSLPSLPAGLTDVLTLVVIGCCGFFLLRRLFLRRVRSLTTTADLLVLLVTALPFVTGFLAYHQWFDYRAMVLAHMLSGELMLVLIPFTKLGHMIYFFLYRFFVKSEYSFKTASRVW